MHLPDHQYAVEFVGGPLDGHKTVVTEGSPLMPAIGVPITRSLLNALTRRREQADKDASHVTSHALYELVRWGVNVHYAYLGVMTPLVAPDQTAHS